MSIMENLKKMLDCNRAEYDRLLGEYVKTVHYGKMTDERGYLESRLVFRKALIQVLEDSETKHCRMIKDNEI